jgi:nucleolar protein 9
VWKVKQGPLRLIFSDRPDKGKASMEDRHPPEFCNIARKFVTMLRMNLDGNKVHSLAANKVACPVLQVQCILLLGILLTGFL